MPKKGITPQKALEIKRRIQTTDRELRHLNEIQWVYSKRMLKFGMAAWIFGLSTFFSAVIVMDAQLLVPTYSIWLPLLILALAAPVAITAALIRKFALKIRYLERIRRDLLAEYEKAILKRVEHMVVGKG
ncbi:MAG: hypothetical protein QMD95_01900 [Candidatus Hodarchaeaceae archaeon]|nr:hypothetical protein [Candidatus Hodarchaeaceae archaeon]